MKRSLFVWAFFIGTPVVAEKPPTFEDAVSCIKRFEGLHAPEHHPYVGYGHRLLAGETFSNPLTEAEADSLLRADLHRKCAVFRRFKQDSLLLGTLAYNVGEYALLGNAEHAKSRLISKLEAGDRDIRAEYLSFRKYRGKVVRSLEERRCQEFDLLFIANQGKDEREYIYTSGCFSGIVADEAGSSGWASRSGGGRPFPAGTPGERLYGIVGRGLSGRVFMVYSPIVSE